MSVPPKAPSLLLLAVGLTLCLLSPLHADWPHLRGPNLDGIATETGLADAWPADGPPQLWSRELGQGYSGFVVAEGKLFTQRQTLAGQYLLCLDPATGNTLWETRYDWPWQPNGAYPGPYASPTFYRGKVYYASPAGQLGCVDAATGASVWSFNVVEKFTGKGCEFGYAATPLIEDDRLIVPVGGPNASLVALHPDDGRTLWTAGSDPASYCPAFPITFRGRRCIVGYLQNTLILVEAATGKLLHRQTLSSGYDEHSAWPLYREPHLFLATPFRLGTTSLELQPGPDDAILARPRWTTREFCNDIVSSVLYRDHVYGFHLRELQANKHRPSRGEFRCLEWETGKVRWSTDRVGHASVLVADGKLLLFNDSGSLILAAADPEEYRELGRTRLFDGEMCWTPPTLSDGRLFVRSPSRAVCVHVGRAEEAPAQTVPAPSVGGSWRLDPTWLLSREREYPNDAPTWEEMSLWFGACLLVFAAAALATGLVHLVARLFGRRLAGWPLFLTLAFVLGLLGPNVFSALADRCLFTWPASVYAAFHATVLVCGWAETQPRAARRPRWLARLTVLGLVLVCWGYFELCRTVGMFVAWSFLFGLPFGFPFTYLAVRAQQKGLSVALSVLLMLLAFAVFFWNCQGLLLWKAGGG